MDPKAQQTQSAQQITPQKIVQQATKSSTQYSPQKKSKKKIITAIFIVFGIFILLTIILLIISRGSTNNNSNSDETSENISENTNPIKVVFLRDGNVWTKELETNTESQIIDTSNQRVNRLLFSDDGVYIGVILFDESLFVAQQNDYGQVFIYDLNNNERINIGAVEFDSANVNEDKYFFTDSCELIEEKYISFCLNYAEYLKDSNDGRIKPYNTTAFNDSKYKEDDFKLIRSKVLTNGLVLIEFENSNSDSYTLLVNEESGETLIKVDDATGTHFIFN